MGEHFHGFPGRFPKNKELNDYILVVVNRFSNICVLVFVRKRSKPKRDEKFLVKVWPPFGFPNPKSIILGKDTMF
jgi:hypothetical protein